MQDNPLITIVMPAYNAQKFIAESVDSVLKQTYTNWELIIVDDGSTDGTAAIVQQLARNDKRIKYAWQDRGRQGKARNLAIKQSNGFYIAFLDADDTWFANKLQLQVDLLISRPEIDLVFCQGYSMQENGKKQPFYVTVKEWSWDDDKETFIDASQIPILSAVVKKEALMKAGLFIEDPAIQNNEDYHLWIKLLHKQYRFLSTADYLFTYRVHAGQSTHKSLGIPDIQLNCYADLVETGVIDRKSAALKNKLKWMIFQDIDLDKLFRKMRDFFPERKKRLTTFILFNRLFPGNKMLKKASFHFL